MPGKYDLMLAGIDVAASKTYGKKDYSINIRRQLL